MVVYLLVCFFCACAMGASIEQSVMQSNLPTLQKLSVRALVHLVQTKPEKFIQEDMHTRLYEQVYKKIAPHFVDQVLKTKIGRKYYTDSRVGRWIQYITCTKDGRHVFTSTPSESSSVCRIDTLKNQCTLIGQFNHVRSLACTADGNKLYIACFDGVYECDVVTKAHQIMYPLPVMSVECTIDGSRIYAINSQYPGRVHELRHDVVQPLYPGANAECVVQSLAIATDGDRVISLVSTAEGVASYGMYILWNRRDEQLSIIAKSSSPRDHRLLACDASASIMFTAHEESIARHVGTRRLDAHTRIETAGGTISSMACTHDGKELFVGTRYGTLYKICTFTRTMSMIAQLGQGIHQLHCAADGSNIFCSSASQLHIWANYLADMRLLANKDFESFKQLISIMQKICVDQPLELGERNRLDGLSEDYPYLQDLRIACSKKLSVK